MMAVAIYLGVVAVMSVVCFIAYGLDKRRAMLDGPRISERSLHWLEFCGGWPGAIVAQRQFRHKTRKLSFQLVFWLVVALHVGLVGVAAYFYFA